MSGTTHLRSTVRIDADVVSAWAAMSGDYNRLHVDPEFAAGTPYGRCIAHGPILVSLVGELLGAHAGEAWPTSARTSFRFVAPVFVPSTIAVEVAIDVSADGGRSAHVECVDQDGTTVLIATAGWGGPPP